MALGARAAPSATAKIHYVTTQGVSDVWVASELRVLQLKGIPFELHAMRRASAPYQRSDWALELHRLTRVMYPLSPIAALGALLAAPFLFGRRFWAAAHNALFGERESVRARVAGLAHFLVACWWARAQRGRGVAHVHSQWIHSGGTIAMYGAWLLDTTFSFTGHAADLFRDRVALRDKIHRAKFIVCISTFHRDFFLREGARREQLQLAHCGIDAELFQPADRRRASDAPCRLLSMGRLIEKKGFDVLIDACARLARQGAAFECVIAGSGPLETRLNEKIQAEGLAARVRLTGTTLAQEDVPAFLAQGDIFCLPCVQAPDGDVDGLPLVLMEAMACGLPVVSTRLVGIPDLVVDSQTGILVPPQDPAALADALLSLMRDAARSRRLAQAGLRHVRNKFEIKSCLQPLLDQFRLSLKLSPAAAAI